MSYVANGFNMRVLWAKDESTTVPEEKMLEQMLWKLDVNVGDLQENEHWQYLILSSRRTNDCQFESLPIAFDDFILFNDLG